MKYIVHICFSLGLFGQNSLCRAFLRFHTPIKIVEKLRVGYECIEGRNHHCLKNSFDEESAPESDSESFDVDIRSLEKLWNSKEMGAVPTNSKEGAEDVVKAARAALMEGKRGQIVDIQAPIFDPAHRVYDQEAFFDFIATLVRGLTFAGNVRLITRDDSMSSGLQERMYFMNEGDMEGIGLSTFLGPEGTKSGMSEIEAVGKYASMLVEEEDNLFVVVLPSSMGELLGLRKVIELASGRPVLVLNPRMDMPPVEMRGYETVYAVLPFVVQQQDQNNQEPPGQILLKKEYPENWKLYISQQGDEEEGYQYINAFETRPSGEEIISLYLQMRS